MLSAATRSATLTRALLVTLTLLLGLSACSGKTPAPGSSGEARSMQSEGRRAAEPGRDTGIPTSAVPVIVALGDSLTAGFGIDAGLSWPYLLQTRLQERGYTHRIVNSGISGDTTADGLARIDWILQQKPWMVLLELGANDALSQVPIQTVRSNLDAMINKCQAAGAKVVLVGMKLPRGGDPAYAAAFEQVYLELASAHQLPLVPSLLDGVAGNSSLNLPDGLHPNAEGQKLLLETVWKVLEPELAKK